MRHCWLSVFSTSYGSMLLLGLVACGSSRAPAQRSDSESNAVSRPTTVLKGPNSRIRHTIREVVRDSIRWRGVWDSLHSYSESGIELPAIDFRHHMLVVALGPAGAPGDSLITHQVIRAGGATRVRVVFYRGCATEAEVTMPFHIVRIPRWQEKPLFEERVVIDPQCIE